MRRHSKWGELVLVTSLIAMGAGLGCSSNDDENPQAPSSNEADGGAGDAADADAHMADVEIADSDSDADISDSGTETPDADAPDGEAPDGESPDAGSEDGDAGHGGEAGTAFDGTGLALGGSHSCAIHEGKAYCWGYNAYGQLGDGTTDLERKPTLVSGLTEVVELALGEDHTCARLQSGRVECWGWNHVGQLGDGTATNRWTPTPIDGLTDVVQIAAGGFHTCARLAGGSVQCWGANSNGQLGDGSTESERLTPTPVPGLTNVVEIALGDAHSCARLEGGSVQCWGRNTYGQLGDDTKENRRTPTQVSGLTNAVELALGMHHSCARLQNGAIQCWGSNTYGQLGDGTQGSGADKLTPTLASGSSDAVAIAVGHQHSCARRQGGSIECWGWNQNGQLGDGTEGYQTNESTPTLVVGLTTAVELAAGGTFTCAREAGGGVKCWGNNVDGQLGDGTRTQRPTPTAVVW